MKSKPITVSVADDHKLLRQGLVRLINDLENFEVVIEASDGDELITLLSRHHSTDICLLDISMPNKNGYETMKVLNKHWPDMTVMAISMFETEYSVLQMLKLGAKGFLSKNFNSSTDLQHALISLYEKGFFLSESVDRKALRALNTNQENIPRISEAEMTFLKHSCTDLSYAEIAQLMNVSKRTVEGYRDSLFYKLSINSRNALSIFAIKNGLVAIESLGIDAADKIT